MVNNTVQNVARIERQPVARIGAKRNPGKACHLATLPPHFRYRSNAGYGYRVGGSIAALALATTSAGALMVANTI